MRDGILKFTNFEFFRFLLSGGFNTLATYLVYLGLLNLFSYRISYTIAYVSGIALAYVLNRMFVFKSHKGAASILLLPLVYVFQYGMGLVILHLWIDYWGMPEKVGPLVVVALTLPVIYLLSRFVFRQRPARG